MSELIKDFTAKTQKPTDVPRVQQPKPEQPVTVPERGEYLWLRNPHPAAKKP